MNIFLREFLKESKGKKIVIVMKGVGCHKSDKIKYSNNIRIIIQPPYLPKLNPIEKL
jgi:transposase